MGFKIKNFAALVMLATMALGLPVLAEDAADRVPFLSNSLSGQVSEDDLNPMPNSERFESVIDPTFTDLSSDPNAEVKFPGGIDKFKGLKKVD